MTTPMINSLLEDKELQRECLSYVSRPGTNLTHSEQYKHYYI